MAAEGWLSLYHRSPAWMWDVAASVRGWQLERWRCGAETERLVEEALERESWTAERWKAWQEEKLARLLDRAAKMVPYYRAMWAERRVRGDAGSWERLENWPVLEKEEVRRQPEAFVAEDCQRERMLKSHTSGTSGTPLKLWQSRRALRQWYALFEARWRRWHGVSRADRWAIFGGQLVAPVERRKPPFWVHNWPMRQLYCSSYHLSPEFVPYYVEELRRFRPVYLWGYSSALYTLARECLRLGVKDLRYRVVLTNAEPLYGFQREAMEEAFDAPVRETYGMSEMAAAAGECEEGRMHWFPDAGVVEVTGEGAGGAGELVVTGLVNEDMPLIRYRVGDRVKPAAEGAECECGRRLPLLERIEGRVDDVIVTPDGRRVGRMDPVFKADLAIREAQIVQEELDLVRVRVVPGAEFGARQEEELKRRIWQRLGEGMRVEVERVKEIERGAGGKFRAVISKVAGEQRR
jgi:phenylacetate-CoA ligase